MSTKTKTVSYTLQESELIAAVIDHIIQDLLTSPHKGIDERIERIARWREIRRKFAEEND
jgi:5'(3')-deoxyribonucleotidase